MATATLQITPPLRLNQPQSAFCSAPIGPTIVLGGAGTGKTTALANRHHTMFAGGEPARSFLILCRSTPAANRYRSILHEIDPDAASQAFIGTIADFAAHFCRYAGAAINGFRRDFTIWHPDQCAHLIAAIVRTQFPQIAQGAPDAHLHVQAWHTFSRNTEDPIRYTPPHPSWLDVAAEYDRIKRVHHAMDIDDLVEVTHNSLLYQDDVRQSWAQNRTSHVFIDDFQDTSPFQYETVKLLLDGRNSLSVATDPNQSTRRHHAASPELVNRFFEDHPNFTHQILVQNHRSTPAILRTTAALKQSPITRDISHDHQQPTRQAGPAVRLAYTHRPEDLANHVRSITDDPPEPGHTTVIICPHRRSLDATSSLLQSLNVPHDAYPPQPLPRCRLLLSVQLALNPSDADALRQLINLAFGAQPHDPDNPHIQPIISLSESADCDLVAATALMARHAGNRQLTAHKLRQLAHQVQAIEVALNRPQTDLSSTIDVAYEIVRRSLPITQRRDYQKPSWTRDALNFPTLPQEDLRDTLHRFIDSITIADLDPPVGTSPVQVTLYHHAKSFQPQNTLIVDLSESNLPTSSRDNHPDLAAENHRVFLNMIASPSDRLFITAPAANPAEALLIIHDTLTTA